MDYELKMDDDSLLKNGLLTNILNNGAIGFLGLSKTWRFPENGGT